MEGDLDGVLDGKAFFFLDRLAENVAEILRGEIPSNSRYLTFVMFRVLLSFLCNRYDHMFRQDIFHAYTSLSHKIYS
jgi:hypothetical protein